METFEIQGDFIQLNQLLKVLNWCESGAQANSVIEEGFVKVNGKVELRKRNKLVKDTLIEFDGNKVKLI
ncbi:MAG TPA: RNA-binding S4 domain-containing protein [Chitinophagales bacterium]|jgi:ribosome-associated protein|nr:RNA-binding S4 domain-containing protein [Chitinophagales bacterium]